MGLVRSVRRHWLLAFVSVGVVAGIVGLSSAAVAASSAFVVDSTSDVGDSNSADGLCQNVTLPSGAQCTLRAAIQQANAIVDGATITFAPSVTVITPGSPLPTITKTVAISACLSGAPTVELVGSSAGPDTTGLTLGAGSSGSVFEGLVIRGWTGGPNGSQQNGIRILATSSNNRVRCNRIGTDLTGTTARPNNVGIQIDSSNNTIGGNAAGDRNLISANFIGIVIQDGASANVVQGNYIGTNAAGDAPVGNVASGIDVRGSSNSIGGTSPNEGNVISGTTGTASGAGTGVHVQLASGNSIEGNHIGTNAAGSLALPNQFGIYVDLLSSATTIGGMVEGAGNLISGNTLEGVLIGPGFDFEGTAVDSTVVQGNKIGTNAAGTVALPNRSGISVSVNTPNTTIGGSAAGAGNLISGNASGGVFLSGASGAVVQGNTISANAWGLAISVGSNNTIGGLATGAGNAIVGNTLEGIRLSGGTTAVGNRILGNSVTANGGLGIDLAADGVTLNDPGDADVGENRRQNFPVLTAASDASVVGTLNSVASRTYRVELFANDSCDTSGFGEGEAFLGFVDVATNASGNGAFSFAPSTALAGGDFITATATDPDGNTSEFSPCLTVPTLTEIEVTPANPSIVAGANQQFTAIGTYSDTSTVDLTSSVTWASASPAVATIGAGGLAHGVSMGTSTISATLGTVSGDTLLTVTDPPLPPGCTKGWAAAVDGSWSDATKWTPAGVPTSTDDVCIAAAGSYTVTLEGSSSVASVTLGTEGNVQRPTLLIRDSVFLGQGELTSVAGFTNHGSLVLDTTAGSGAHLAILSGAFTNAGDGDVTVNPGIPVTISGSFVNEGSFTVAAGATLNLAGSAPSFDQDAGTLTVAGSFPATGATFTYHGGAIPNSLVLRGATLALAAPAAVPKTFVFEGAGNVLAGDVLAGHALRIRDSVFFGQGALTSVAGFTNHGSVEFDPSAGSGTQLTMLAGAFTNGPAGSVTVEPGIPATINGPIVNNGSFSVAAGASLSLDGQIVNAGVFTAGGGTALHLTGSTSFLDQSAGTLTVEGSFSVNGGTVIYKGGSIPNPLVLRNATLDLAAATASPDTFVFEGAGNVLAGDVLAGHTLRIRDSVFFGQGALTSVAGFTNHGSVEFDPSSGSGTQLTMLAGAFTSGAAGSVTVEPGIPATINGPVVNNGSFTVAAGAMLNLAGAAPSFDQNAGTLTVAGSFPATGATFTYNGGAIPNPLVLRGATLALAAPAAVPKTFVFEGAGNVLAGDVLAGHTLRIRDSAAFGQGDLTSVAGFTNHGNVVFDPSLGSGARLTMLAGAFTNGPAGSVSVEPGVPATVSGPVVNAGSFTVPTGATLNLAGSAPSFDQDAGILAVAGSLPATGATITYHGGVIPNPLVLRDATLDVAAPAATPKTFVFEGAGNVLAGDVLAGHTLRIRDSVFFGQGALTSVAGFTNHGNVVFDPSLGSGARLAVLFGTFTNAGDGTVTVDAGVPATISGRVVNAGSFSVAAGARVDVGGTYSQASGGDLEIALAGDVSGAPLTLTGGNSASLDGVLSIRFVEGFVPTAGQEFTLLTYASSTGTFSLDLPEGFSGHVAYGATDAVLTVTGVLDSIVVTPPNPSIATGTDQQFTATAFYSDASSADVTESATWASGNPAVATIDADGLAHGLSDGTSTISATLGTVTGQTLLTVVGNRPPLAGDDEATTAEDTHVDISVLANDSDADGDPLTIAEHTPPANGTVTENPDHTLRYAPVANFHGSDSFAYTISDGQGEIDTATVTVTVTAVNDAPVAFGDARTTPEDTTLSASVPAATDVDDDVLTYQLVDTTEGLDLDPDGSYTYTPPANFHGQVAFTYRASDTVASSNLATVTITVTPVNDAPVAFDDTETTAEDSTLSASVPAAVDVDGDALTYALELGTMGLSFEANGSYTYSPPANFHGQVSFIYRASDGTASSNLATVTITVTPVNDAPVAEDASVTTPEDTPVGFVFAGSDVDGDVLSFEVVTGPAHGTLAGRTFTPALDYHGPDSVTFRASDGTLTDDAVVTITVTPVNDSPVADDDEATTAEDTPMDVAVLENDTDADGGTLTVTDFTQPEQGTVSANADGTLEYAPNADFHGSDSFTYTISDGQGGSDTASVFVTVTSVNDLPEAFNDAQSTPEDTTLTASVPAADDVEGDTLTYALVFGTPGLSFDPAGSYVYLPPADFNGSVSFTYRANDGLADSNVATVTITVTPVNDAPIAAANAATTDAGVAVDVDVLANDLDVDGDTLAVDSFGQGIDGTVGLVAGSLRYTPNAGFSGTDSFTYRASDGSALSNSATVTITVVEPPPPGCSKSWAAPVDGFWSDATRWTPSGVPTSADAVCMTGGGYTVTVDGSQSAGSVTLGTAGNVARPTLLITDSPLFGAGALTSLTGFANHGHLVLENGLGFGAFLTASAGAFTNATDGTVTITGNAPAVITGPVVNEGSFTVAAGASLGLGGSVPSFDQDAGTLTVEGSFPATNATFTYNGGAIPNPLVLRGATLNLAAPATVAKTFIFESSGNQLAGNIPSGHTVLVRDSGTYGHGALTSLTGFANHGHLVLENGLGFGAFLTASAGAFTNASDGTATITGNAPAVITGPVVNAGSFTVAAGASLGLGGSVPSFDQDAGILTVEGSFPATNATFSYNGGAIPNPLVLRGATLNLAAPATVAKTFIFESSGNQLAGNIPSGHTVLVRDSGTYGHGALTSLTGFANHGHLVLENELGFGAFLTASAGAFTNASDGTATITGVAPATITGPVVNAGSFEVAGGASVNLTGSFTQAASGELDIELAGPVTGSVLALPADSASFDGVLRIGFTGGFTPTAGQMFTLLTYASSTGTFALEMPDGFTGNVAYGATSAVLTVNGAVENAPPDAVDDAATTTEDTPIDVDVLPNDTDADGDPLTITAVSEPSNGVVSENADHTLHYVPALDFHGSDLFTYTVSDGQGGTDTATVTITVTPINDAPVAFDDAKLTAEDSTLNASVPAATDFDGDTLTYTLELGTAGLNFDPDGSYSYVPPADFNGSASFTYRANDGSASSNLATVTITVTPVNDPPTLTVRPTALTMDEDAAAQSVTVSGADRETAPGDLAYEVTQAPAHGTLRQGLTTLTAGSSFATGTVGTFLGTSGSAGSGTGQFQNPSAVAVAPGGGLYVVDSGNSRIQRFMADGAFVNAWGSPGPGIGQFSSPNGIAVAPDGSVYVADSANSRIQRFTADGSFISAWGSVGSGNGQFIGPQGLAVAADGSVYVADTFNHRIQWFTPSGAFVGAFGTMGSGPGQLDRPFDLAVAPDGGIYVVDWGNNRIQRFTAGGSFVSMWGGSGVNDGRFNLPQGIAVAPDGNVYVADTNSHRIQKFTRDGAFVGKWGTFGSGNGQFRSPRRAAFASDGSVYVADSGNHRIQRFVVETQALLTYTPDPNFNGSDSFTVEVTDRGDPDNCGVLSLVCDAAASDQETVLVTVNPVNDAPVAVDDAATTDQGVALAVDVLANDLDVDADPLAVASFGQGENGTVALVAGKLRYTPDVGFSGSDSFAYRASDGVAVSNEATVRITVQAAANAAPDAVNDVKTTAEDTPTDVDVLANDADADGDPLTITAFTQPEHGIVTLVAGSLRYAPAANFNGSDSFTYEISDGQGGSDTATISVTVTAVNDAPVASNDTRTTAEDTTLVASIPAGVDIDGDSLAYELELGTAGLDFEADGSYTYLPPANFHGSVSFTYWASDGVADSNVATVTITVTSVNDAPSAEDASVTTPEDTPVELVFAGSDVDGDAMTFEVVGGPAHGTLVGTTYTPELNYHGPDSITFRASDGALTDDAVVTITVTPVNDAPVAVDDAATTDQGVAVDVDLLANDLDVDGDTLKVASFGQGENGTVALVGGTLRYTPAAGFSGSDSFTYRAIDGSALSNLATVTITMHAAANAAPDAVDDEATTAEDTPTDVEVLANDTDADGDPLTITHFTQSSNGVVSENTDHTLRYAPAPDFHGSDSFTYTISDGQGGTDTATVTITLTVVNDPPTLTVSPTALTMDEDAAAQPVTVTGTDKETAADNLAFKVTQAPAHGTLRQGTTTLTPGSTLAVAGTTGTFLGKWGSLGAGDGQFTHPPSVAVAPDGSVYVADANNRIQRFTASGAFLGKWGSPGSGDGQFNNPRGVAVAPDGSVYVADTNNQRIQRFTASGAFLGKWGSPGSGDGQFNGTFNNALGVAVAPDGSVYVVDVNNQRIQRFTASGAFLGKWGSPGPSDGQFNNPLDVAVAPDGSVYVSDLSPGRIQRFTASGAFLGKWGSPGSDDGHFGGPQGVAVAPDGSVYVADAGNRRIQRFTASGAFLGKWGSPGSGDGQFNNPVAVAVAPDGSAYVADYNNHQIQRFTTGASAPLTYTPDANFNGSDSFTVEVTDRGDPDDCGVLSLVCDAAASDQETVLVTVNPVNDAPVAVDDAATTDQGVALAVDVLANDLDVDADPLAVASFGQGENGTVALVAGKLRYTPDVGFSGSDSFAYRASDGVAVSNEATVRITVQAAANAAPDAVNDVKTTAEDTPTDVDVLANDADADGDPLTITAFTQPEHGIVTLVAGSLRYAPAANFNGSDSFTYEISDGQGGSDTATISVTVTAVNDAPVASNDTRTTAEDTLLNISVPAASDVDGDALSYGLIATTAGLGFNSDGSYSYTPPTNFNGSASFTYRANDGTTTSNLATVTITVTAANDPPVAANDSISVPGSGSLTFEARANDTAGPANESGQVLGKPTITQPPAHGTTSVNSSGTITYVPTPSYAGPDSFKYQVCDNGTTNGAPDPRCAEGTVAVVVKSALEQLQDLINDNPGPFAGKLLNAFDKVRAAAQKLTTTPPDRQGALGELKSAVGDLEAAVKGGQLSATLGASLIDRICASSRALAQDAISEATARGGKAAKINQARQALATADARRAAGQFKDAIAGYKDAVSKAEGA